MKEFLHAYRNTIAVVGQSETGSRVLMQRLTN